jgi:rhodanese-related sulfurtransferase
VSIPEAQHAAVQWSIWPGGVPNPHFTAELAAVASKDQVLLFLCRSGVRSRHAARLATENGYTQCYDILEGFEGDKDSDGHRKTVGGWCKSGLPWLGA